MELYLLILLPILASLFLYLIPSKITNILSIGVYLAVLIFASSIFIRVRFMGITISTSQTDSFLGITLYCDHIAAVFLVLVSFLFLCMFLYASVHDKANKLFSFLFTVLEGLVMLIFLSDDLFNIFVAIEVSAIVCAILIMFKRESRSIYDGLVYLLINIIGMLFLLLGIGGIYRQLGVLDLSAIAAAVQSRPPEELTLSFALLITGVLLKCAIFPLHFWLPTAHGTPGAPTVVSAILSGVYVKSGIYLFMRIEGIFGEIFPLSDLFFWLAVITSIAGIIMAVCQNDIKLILAYHTISQIGLIIAGLSVDNEYVQAGAVLHIVNHAIFKSLLFLAAGMIIKKYNTRNIYKIKGVLRSVPLAGIAIICGIFGITGAPFFNGSISKYFIGQTTDLLSTLIFTVINFGTILSFVKFKSMLFGKKRTLPFVYDFSSTAVILTLSALCLLTGIFAEPFLFFVLGIPLNIGVSGYISKTAVWAASFILAILFYEKIIKKSARIKVGIDFTVDLNTMAVCIGGGFMVIIGYLFIAV